MTHDKFESKRKQLGAELKEAVARLNTLRQNGMRDTALWFNALANQEYAETALREFHKNHKPEDNQ